MQWWIGCSGFHYKGWKDRFYPPKLPQRLWFEFYCQFYNTLEINVTFYRFPRIKTLQEWYNRSPLDFRFTVKAPRLITHYKRFHNAGRQIHDFYSIVGEGLQEKLGCILFQLNPDIAYTPDNLNRILDALDPAFDNVVEFRHQTWWTEDVYRELHNAGVTFCGISYPGLPDNIISGAPRQYYRFHGVPQLYLSSYSSTELKRVAKHLKQAAGNSEVYVYFNNDIEVAAIANAKALQQIVGVTRFLPMDALKNVNGLAAGK